MVKWLIGGVIVLAMVAACAPVADTVDARAAVANAIEHDGGKQIKNLTLRYLDEFEGIYVVATVQGLIAVDGSAFDTTIPMSRENGRYYLALGQGTPTGNEADTSSPSAVP